MTERPILFSAPMVRAILAGTKTQTPRVVKPWEPRLMNLRRPVPEDVSYLPDFTCYQSTCPYGQPGDRLWVRETFGHFERNDELRPGAEIFYRADGEAPAIEPWRPSIHMPRWASRLTPISSRPRRQRDQRRERVDRRRPRRGRPSRPRRSSSRSRRRPPRRRQPGAGRRGRGCRRGPASACDRRLAAVRPPLGDRRLTAAADAAACLRRP